MLCRACGTEIADKAIVCYRCGAPTAAPASAQSPRAGGRGRRLGAAAAILLLVAGAVLLAPRIPAGMPSFVAGAGLAAAVLVIVRLAMRRRGR